MNVTILNFNESLELSIEPIRIAYCLLPALLTVFTIVGNLFVVLAICLNSRLNRKCTSVLIFNLALADLLIGITIMPMAVTQIVTAGVWPLSRLLCRIWTSLDVICCTASIVTLCIISLDRFIGVTRPLKYAYLVTRRRLMISMLLVWLFSLTTLLVTIRWSEKGAIAIDSRVCVVGNELEYVISSVILSFFIPLSVIVLIYGKIYLITKRREESLNPVAKPSSSPSPKKPSSSALKRSKSILEKNPKAAKEVNAAIFAPLRIHYGGGVGNGSLSANGHDVSAADALQNKRRKFFRMHMKTTKTLGLVVGAFILCWLPFFVLYSINNAFHDLIPDLALDICTWLGYSNSALNPIIYAVSMRSFGRVFKDIFFRHVYYPIWTCCGLFNNHRLISGYDSSRKSSEANTLLTNCNNSRRDSMDCSYIASEIITVNGRKVSAGVGRRSVDFSANYKKVSNFRRPPPPYQLNGGIDRYRHNQHRTSVDQHRQVLVKRGAMVTKNARSLSLACTLTEQERNINFQLSFTNSRKTTQL